LKNILLTGRSGFLGNYIYNSLIFENYDVDTLGRSNINQYQIDLTKKILHFSNNKYDLVIHAAGLAHIETKTIEEKNQFYDINVEGTKNLLEGLSNSNIPKHFIFISSVSVYGLLSGVLINENAPLLAEDAYGRSKIESENLVKKWCINNGVLYTILRLPLLVGKNPPGNLGSMIDGLKKGYYFHIGGGNAKKSMVLASDVAKFIIKAAEKGGTYNLTDGVNPSFKELSEHLLIQLQNRKIYNFPIWVASILSKIGDLIGNSFPINSKKLYKITSTLTFDDSKARIAFGWEPKFVLSESLI
jgi:nucleoside-diphosphate-sugar epimerase